MTLNNVVTERLATLFSVRVVTGEVLVLRAGYTLSDKTHMGFFQSTWRPIRVLQVLNGTLFPQTGCLVEPQTLQQTAFRTILSESVA